MQIPENKWQYLVTVRSFSTLWPLIAPDKTFFLSKRKSQKTGSLLNFHAYNNLHKNEAKFFYTKFYYLHLEAQRKRRYTLYKVFRIFYIKTLGFSI